MITGSKAQEALKQHLGLFIPTRPPARGSTPAVAKTTTKRPVQQPVAKVSAAVEKQISQLQQEIQAHKHARQLDAANHKAALLQANLDRHRVERDLGKRIRELEEELNRYRQREELRSKLPYQKYLRHVGLDKSARALNHQFAEWRIEKKKPVKK